METNDLKREDVLSRLRVIEAERDLYGVPIVLIPESMLPWEVRYPDFPPPGTEMTFAEAEEIISGFAEEGRVILEGRDCLPAEE